jgi:hypothetical protein
MVLCCTKNMLAYSPTDETQLDNQMRGEPASNSSCNPRKDAGSLPDNSCLDLACRQAQCMRWMAHGLHASVCMCPQFLQQGGGGSNLLPPK